MSLESLDLREVESAIEGILFASGEPLAIDRICLALDLDRPTAEQVLQKLGDYYAFERRGIRLIRMEDSYHTGISTGSPPRSTCWRRCA